ncbi:MAG TPA: hypothetical protein VGO36_06080 [Solirubrobacterales bacterium]|jgi:hypothetical protein|nr:hypothetical protein [Solirubrobacterales bacterium]
MAPGLRRLYAPQPVSVRTDLGGRPLALDGVEVAAVREEWVIEDRWWIPQPLQRHYFELALANGRAAVVFRNARSGCWQRQRA